MNDKKITDQEIIDLDKIFRGLTDFFRRNSRLLIVFTLIGLAIGLTRFYTAKVVYKSSLLVRSNQLPYPYSREFIITINNLANEQNSHELMEKLGIGKKETLAIKSVVADKIGENPLFFLIEIEVYDTLNIKALEKGLITYMSRNKYIVSVKKSAIDAIKESLQETEKLIANTRALRHNRPNLIGDIKYYQSLDLSLIQLQERKMKLRKSLIEYNKDNYEIVNPFTIYKKKYPTEIFPNVTWSAIIGFLLGCVTSIILYNYKNKRKV